MKLQVVQSRDGDQHGQECHSGVEHPGYERVAEQDEHEQADGRERGEVGQRLNPDDFHQAVVVDERTREVPGVGGEHDRRSLQHLRNVHGGTNVPGSVGQSHEPGEQVGRKPENGSERRQYQ